MSKFNIDRKLFVENFLQPINKVSEQCVIELENDIARVVVSDSNTTMILFGETKVDYTDTPARLNIGDVQRIAELSFARIPGMRDQIDFREAR